MVKWRLVLLCVFRFRSQRILGLQKEEGGAGEDCQILPAGNGRDAEVYLEVQHPWYPWQLAVLRGELGEASNSGSIRMRSASSNGNLISSTPRSRCRNRFGTGGTGQLSVGCECQLEVHERITQPTAT
uniref:Putative secreted protein n=1 Tax=Anopheles darlingi TaxID=43151 RepID=A0A2M4DCA5_ANODA